MILRGSQVADRRHVLLSAQPTGAVAAGEALVERAASEMQRASDKSVAEVSEPEVRHEEAKKQEARPELSFEAVAAWLVIQDNETREACASLLAQEVALVYEKAKADGFSAGERAAAEESSKKTMAAIKLLEGIGEAAEVAYAEEQRALQDTCVEVVMTAFSKIAGPLLAAESATLGAVNEVLRHIKEEREIVIRVSRGDAETLQGFKEELAGALQGRKFEIIADSRVALGGCIVETKSGSLDGRFDVQLRELYETLRLAKQELRETR